MSGAIRRVHVSHAATLVCALVALVAASRAYAADDAASAGADAPRPLRVCLLAHAAPLSEQAPGTGFDVDVMSAVAARLGVAMTPVWIENDARITEVETGDLPLAPLARGRCDATPSVPGEAALRGASDRLRLTQA